MKHLTILLALLINLTFAQEIGKIFQNEEVLELFGEKISEVKFETEIIRKAIPEAGEYILFKAHNDDVIICDSFLRILYPKDKIEYIEPEWRFKVFSVSIVERLLDSRSINPEKFVYLETREKDVVLRYELQTLDRGLLCPVSCPGDFHVTGSYLHINGSMVTPVNK